MGQPTRGAIAAGHPQTVAAGEEMLRLGGNAFDAVAAAMAASFVTEPGLTSAAGGGFLLAHTPNHPNGHQNTLFDFFADLHPNGFHQWPENVRISSMMAPTIVLKNTSNRKLCWGPGLESHSYGYFAGVVQCGGFQYAD